MGSEHLSEVINFDNEWKETGWNEIKSKEKGKFCAALIQRMEGGM